MQLTLTREEIVKIVVDHLEANYAYGDEEITPTYPYRDFQSAEFIVAVPEKEDEYEQ